MTKIGARLREERTRLGLSQTDFGAAGGVKLGAQHAYESGKRSPDANYLAAIAAKGVDVGYVVTGVRDAGPESPADASLADAIRRLSQGDRAAILQIVESLGRS